MDQPILPGGYPMTTRITFGTDGWRGSIAEDYTL